MKHSFLMIWLFFLLACNSSDKNLTTSAILTSQNSDSIYITIIDKHNRDSSFSYWGLTFADSLGNKFQFQVKNNEGYYSIPLNSKSVFWVGNTSIGFDEILLHPGDTLNVISKQRDFDVTIRNRNQNIKSSNQFFKLFAEKNKNILEKSSRYKDSFYLKSFISGNIYTLKVKNPVDQFKIKYVDSIIEINEAIYNSELETLDSLKKKQQISSDYYYWISKKIFYDLLSKQHKFFSDKKGDYKQYVYSKNFQQDSLLTEFFPDYRNFLETTFLQRIILGDKRIQIGKNTFSFNYKTAFQRADTFLEKKSSDYVKFHCLKFIKSDNLPKEFQSLSSVFLKSTASNSYKEYLVNNLIFIDTSHLDETILKTNEKKILDLKNIIKDQKGKLIYIDLWASWCSPCRAEMPDSKELRASFNRSDITFLYLSIDDDFKKWDVASADEGLADYQYSYLIHNSKSSKFLKEINLQSIPRYIIIGKNGEILNANAPNPSNFKTKKMLEELL